MPRIRVLQTSDLQMRPDRLDSLRVLDQILDTARERSADMVIIAGDLIDRSADPALMATIIRAAIERYAPLPVVILPGHDDASAFDENTNLGSNAVPLPSTPVHKTTVCGIDIVGVPWQRDRTLAECLVGVSMDPRHTIVVAHATLATGMVKAFCGEGAFGAFMPAFTDDLFRRCTYAALGHLHSGENLVHREGERLVAYAGSPLAHSPQELGRRGVLIVDFETSVGVVNHEFLPLATQSYALVEESCLPGEEAAAIHRIARRVKKARGPNICVRARLSGIALQSSDSLHTAMAAALEQGNMQVKSVDGAAAKSNLQIEIDVADFSVLADIPVVIEFIAKLRMSPDHPHEPDETVLRAALELGLHSFREALP